MNIPIGNNNVLPPVNNIANPEVQGQSEGELAGRPVEPGNPMPNLQPPQDPENKNLQDMKIEVKEEAPKQQGEGIINLDPNALDLTKMTVIKDDRFNHDAVDGDAGHSGNADHADNADNAKGKKKSGGRPKFTFEEFEDLLGKVNDGIIKRSLTGDGKKLVKADYGNWFTKHVFFWRKSMGYNSAAENLALRQDLYRAIKAHYDFASHDPGYLVEIRSKLGLGLDENNKLVAADQDLASSAISRKELKEIIAEVRSRAAETLDILLEVRVGVHPDTHDELLFTSTEEVSKKFTDLGGIDKTKFGWKPIFTKEDVNLLRGFYSLPSVKTGLDTKILANVGARLKCALLGQPMPGNPGTKPVPYEKVVTQLRTELNEIKELIGTFREQVRNLNAKPDSQEGPFSTGSIERLLAKFLSCQTNVGSNEEVKILCLVDANSRKPFCQRNVDIQDPFTGTKTKGTTLWGVPMATLTKYYAGFVKTLTSLQNQDVDAGMPDIQLMQAFQRIGGQLLTNAEFFGEKFKFIGDELMKKSGYISDGGAENKGDNVKMKEFVTTYGAIVKKEVEKFFENKCFSTTFIQTSKVQGKLPEYVLKDKNGLEVERNWEAGLKKMETRITKDIGDCAAIYKRMAEGKADLKGLLDFGLQENGPKDDSIWYDVNLTVNEKENLKLALCKGFMAGLEPDGELAKLVKNLNESRENQWKQDIVSVKTLCEELTKYAKGKLAAITNAVRGLDVNHLEAFLAKKKLEGLEVDKATENYCLEARRIAADEMNRKAKALIESLGTLDPASFYDGKDGKALEILNELRFLPGQVQSKLNLELDSFIDRKNDFLKTQVESFKHEVLTVDFNEIEKQSGRTFKNKAVLDALNRASIDEFVRNEIEKDFPGLVKNWENFIVTVVKNNSHDYAKETAETWKTKRLEFISNLAFQLDAALIKSSGEGGGADYAIKDTAFHLRNFMAFEAKVNVHFQDRHERPIKEAQVIELMEGVMSAMTTKDVTVIDPLSGQPKLETNSFLDVLLMEWQKNLKLNEKTGGETTARYGVHLGDELTTLLGNRKLLGAHLAKVMRKAVNRHFTDRTKNFDTFSNVIDEEKRQVLYATTLKDAKENSQKILGYIQNVKDSKNVNFNLDVQGDIFTKTFKLTMDNYVRRKALAKDMLPFVEQLFSTMKIPRSVAYPSSTGVKDDGRVVTNFKIEEYLASNNLMEDLKPKDPDGKLLRTNQWIDAILLDIRKKVTAYITKTDFESDTDPVEELKELKAQITEDVKNATVRYNAKKNVEFYGALTMKFVTEELAKSTKVEKDSIETAINQLRFGTDEPNIMALEALQKSLVTSKCERNLNELLLKGLGHQNYEAKVAGILKREGALDESRLSGKGKTDLAALQSEYLKSRDKALEEVIVRFAQNRIKASIDIATNSGKTGHIWDYQTESKELARQIIADIKGLAKDMTEKILDTRSDEVKRLYQIFNKELDERLAGKGKRSVKEIQADIERARSKIETFMKTNVDTTNTAGPKSYIAQAYAAQGKGIKEDDAVQMFMTGVENSVLGNEASLGYVKESLLDFIGKTNDYCEQKKYLQPGSDQPSYACNYSAVRGEIMQDVDKMLDKKLKHAFLENDPSFATVKAAWGDKKNLADLKDSALTVLRNPKVFGKADQEIVGAAFGKNGELLEKIAEAIVNEAKTERLVGGVLSNGADVIESTKKGDKYIYRGFPPFNIKNEKNCVEQKCKDKILVFKQNFNTTVTAVENFIADQLTVAGAKRKKGSLEVTIGNATCSDAKVRELILEELQELLKPSGKCDVVGIVGRIEAKLAGDPWKLTRVARYKAELELSGARSEFEEAKRQHVETLANVINGKIAGAYFFEDRDYQLGPQEKELLADKVNEVFDEMFDWEIEKLAKAGKHYTKEASVDHMKDVMERAFKVVDEKLSAAFLNLIHRAAEYNSQHLGHSNEVQGSFAKQEVVTNRTGKWINSSDMSSIFNTYMPDFLEKILSQKNPAKTFYLAVQGTDRERQSILRPDRKSGIDVLNAWQMDDDWYLDIVWKRVERFGVSQAKKGLAPKVMAFTLDEI